MRSRFPGRALTRRGSAGRAAVIARLGIFVRLVAAGPHRGLDGLEVRAGLRVEQSGQPRHAVGALRAEVQPAAPGPVLVAEQAVGIEVVGDALTQFRPRYRRRLWSRARPACARRLPRRPAIRSAGSTSTARHTARMWSSPISAGLNGGRQLGNSGGSGGPVNDRRGRIRTASLNRRVISLGVMRSRFHSTDRICAMDPVSSGGSAISAKIRYIKPAVGALLGLQPFRDVDAKPVAHQIRRRIAQQVVGSVDRIESGSDPFPCLARRRSLDPYFDAMNQPDNPASADRRKARPVDQMRNCG